MSTGNHVTTERMWARFMVAVLLTVLVAGLVLTWVQVSVDRNARNALQVSEFISSAQRGQAGNYTAVYQVTGDNITFNSIGMVTISEMPGPPKTVSKPNKYGVSGSGKHAYIFRETSGNLVQWILNGSNASWCMRLPTFKQPGLQCYGPTPDAGGNAFAMQLPPFVPTRSLQEVESFNWWNHTGHARPPTISVERSVPFGDLRCLHQYQGSQRLTTCVDASGFIVSSFWRSYKNWSKAGLTSFSHRVVPQDFEMMAKSSTEFVPVPPL